MGFSPALPSCKCVRYKCVRYKHFRLGGARKLTALPRSAGGGPAQTYLFSRTLGDENAVTGFYRRRPIPFSGLNLESDPAKNGGDFVFLKHADTVRLFGSAVEDSDAAKGCHIAGE